MPARERRFAEVPLPIVFSFLKLTVLYHLTLTAASWQLAANLLPFDRKPAFMGIWQYAWKIAWATEKSVVILGDYCLLPNPNYLLHTHEGMCRTKHGTIEK